MKAKGSQKQSKRTLPFVFRFQSSMEDTNPNEPSVKGNAEKDS